MQTIVELPEFQKKAERNELAKFTSLLLKHYGGSNG